MASLEPVSGKHGVISGRRREGDGNSRPARDFNAAKASSGLVESKRRKVVEAADLILGLKNVSEIPPRWDRTVCTRDPILP